MKTFAISGRCIAAPPPATWRAELGRMLGAKPRRIGLWAELGLYGALRCMHDAGEATLPADAQLWLTSRRGTYTATDMVLEQLKDDLPMPLAFLQTQPSQLLASLSASLGWQGNACFLAGSAPQAVLQLAAAQATSGGLLLGVVDEMAGGSTNWLRLMPVVPSDAERVFAPGADMFDPALCRLRVSPGGLEFSRDPRLTLDRTMPDDRIRMFPNFPQMVAWPH